jgi:hypothetical protein
MIPPAYDNSWANRSSAGLTRPDDYDPTEPVCGARSADWTWLDTINGNARIWWKKANQTDFTIARTILDEWDGMVYPKLRSLMGRDKLPDVDEACNGGNERLDIYLVELGGSEGTKGFNKAYEPHCGTRPTFLQINRRLPANQLRSVLAHEAMHSFQWAFPVDSKCYREDYKWWMEATATWAEHYVYPHDNDEHLYTSYFLKEPERPFETDTNYHQYGAYLLPFFLSQRYEPELIRKSWEAMEEHDSLAGIDSVMAGGWKQQWPEFARLNWNRKPVDDYQRWDQVQLGATPAISTAVEMQGRTDLQYALPAEIPHLATRYYRWTFADETARNITFYNGLTFNLQRAESTQNSEYLKLDPVTPEQQQGARVQALIKLEGEPWQTADWTGLPIATFCRDKRSERLEELVLIMSNSEFADRDYVLKPVGDPPLLTVDNIGCWKWQGTITRTLHNHGTPHYPGFDDLTLTTNVVWEPFVYPPITKPPYYRPLAGYNVQSGTIHWKQSSETYAEGVLICAGSIDTRVALPRGSGRMIIDNATLPPSRFFEAEGTLEKAGNYPEVCNGEQVQTPTDLRWMAVDRDTFTEVERNGTTIKGSWTEHYEDDTVNIDETVSWEFTAVRE